MTTILQHFLTRQIIQCVSEKVCKVLRDDIRTQLSYTSKFRYKKYDWNINGEKLKGTFPLSQLKNQYNNERRHFIKHLINSNIINVHAQKNSKQQPHRAKTYLKIRFLNA